MIAINTNPARVVALSLGCSTLGSPKRSLLRSSRAHHINKRSSEICDAQDRNEPHSREKHSHSSVEVIWIFPVS